MVGNRARILVAVVAALTLVATAACGSDSSVGSGLEAGGGGGDGALRDQDETTTTVGGNGDATTTAAPTTTAAAVATTQAPASTTTTQAAPKNVIKIQDDEQGRYFDPGSFAVPRGGDVTWTNVGTKVRSVEANDGTFVSPDIPPGGSWTWHADVEPKVYDYVDGSRPYAVGSIQVY